MCLTQSEQQPTIPIQVALGSQMRISKGRTVIGHWPACTETQIFLGQG